MPTRIPAPVPLWLNLALTGFVIVLIPIYWRHYGWHNFLWLSDIALFLTVVSLWRTSPLINSMLGIGVLPLEMFWNIDFFTRLITGMEVGGIAQYMFDESLPLHLRALSLFHIALPITWITLLKRWGYDPRAFKAQTLLLWVALLASYGLTRPDENINWVFMPYKSGWQWIPELAWLIAYMLLVPALVHWPLHKLYSSQLAKPMVRKTLA
jgi:hypothetical protein